MYIFENFLNHQLILHYTLIIVSCITLQEIFDTITAPTGCTLYRHKGTSKYFCEKCNVGLHPDCFKQNNLFKYSKQKCLCNNLHKNRTCSFLHQ